MGHNVSSWHCFSSHSTFCSAKLVSVMETCNYSTSEQTHFGNCCVRAFYGCLADLEVYLSLSRCMCAGIICACAAEREQRLDRVKDPVLKVQIVGLRGAESNWGDHLCSQRGFTLWLQPRLQAAPTWSRCSVILTQHAGTRRDVTVHIVTLRSVSADCL